MRATKRRTGAMRLQALHAETAAGGDQASVKPLASYFSAPTSAKVVRAKTTPDAPA